VTEPSNAGEYDARVAVLDTSVHGPIIPRWRWAAVFFSGLILWILSIVVTELTGNPTLIPTVVLLGSFLVPATAVVFYLDHAPSATITAQRVFFAFAYGGVVGVLAASVLEAWLLQDGPFVYLGVGLIEEFAKVLVLLFAAIGIRRYTMRDGIILGAAVGFGFAAFESAGYALNELFTPFGPSLTNVVYAEVLRGVLAPVGHGLWTGLLGGALFAAAATSGRLAVLAPRFIGLFLAVSALHALWDSMRGIAIVLTLIVTASPALPALMEQGILPRSNTVIQWIFNAIQFGGLGLISIVGLAMLRRAWHRANSDVAD
jgi:RsiW-degrading membrane proteinase PrsW (M82 family)